MENNGVGVKRGAWTNEEDVLLRNCIEKYGEGNWNQVPLRAGLNRCRKSCRLRWLNYLRPNLKRGYFTNDEVDLILRIHRLLGNRWSLIAGRLPGRTANDVKNFWNSHIVKKSPAARRKTMQKTITESNIIKPRPRTLGISKSHIPACPSEVTKTNESNDEDLKIMEPSSTASSSKYDENLSNKQPSSSSQEEPNDRKHGDETPQNNQPSPSLSQQEVDECIQWWSNLLEVTENEEGLCVPASNCHNQDGVSCLSIDNVLELLSFDLQ